MRLRDLILTLFAGFALLLTSASASTPTEAHAIAAARNGPAVYWLAPEQLAKAKSLSRTRHIVYWANTVEGLTALWLLLRLKIAARIDLLAERLSPYKWTRSLIFVLLLNLLLTLLSLPIDVFDQRVHRSLGLSVQPWTSWFTDLSISFGLVSGLGWLGVRVLYRLIRKFPKLWWAWAAILVMALSVAGVFATPYLIDPLFNRFEPLTRSNPKLVARLEQVVAQGDGIQIPPERMFLMKASAKVTTLNAYVTGFGATKRVVVWDTSIEKATPEEILFIFGHEMGHYRLGHIVRSLLFSSVLILGSFFLGFHVFDWLLRRYGIAWGIPTQDNQASLVLMLLVLSGLWLAISPLAAIYSRSNEHAADVYGQEVIHGIVPDPQTTASAAFQLLGESSLDDPAPHPFYEFWLDSHPPIWFRTAFAARYDPWTEGQAPKYFRRQP